jgi:hypothetical protein
VSGVGVVSRFQNDLNQFIRESLGFWPRRRVCAGNPAAATIFEKLKF